MNISKVVTDVIHLELGIRDLYEEIAREKEKENTEVARVVRILARESEAHARKLRARHKTIVNQDDAADQGVTGMLSLITESVAGIKEKTRPVEILREGINLEKYMEQLYRELADSYKLEEQAHESLDEGHKEASKLVKIFREIAKDEIKHQQMLRTLIYRIIERNP